MKNEIKLYLQAVSDASVQISILLLNWKSIQIAKSLFEVNRKVFLFKTSLLNSLLFIDINF